jgi:uncharacterized membrane protein
MKERIGKSFGFLRTTALGGLFFLLPLFVLGALLGYVYSAVIVIYEPLKEQIPVSTPTGVATLFAMAVGILLLLCFAAGIIARRAIGRKFSRTVEKQLMTVFPKYAVYKDLLADNIGGPDNVPSLDPVCIRHGKSLRLAFAADRLANGLVAVYMPGAPDTWIGHVELVPADWIEPVDVPFSEFLGIFERLGRDSAKMLADVTLPQ